MMSDDDFKVGQHVACVDAEGTTDLVRGRVYTIREVLLQTYNVKIDAFGAEITSVPIDPPGLSVRLVEVTQRTCPNGVPVMAPHHDFPFPSGRFKPLPRITVDQFTSNTEPALS